MEDKVYSSPQLFGALDDMIYSGVNALLQKTQLVQYYVSQLLNYQNTYKKRRVSYEHGWLDGISALARFLHTGTLEDFKAISLDRGFILAMFDDFLCRTEGYEDLYWQCFEKRKLYYTRYGLQLHLYHASVYLVKGRDMIQLVRQIQYLRQQVSRLKSKMLMDFSDYIARKANRDARSINLPIDVQDLCQNYYMAANKAIDHFNLDRGAFKSYLDVWLKKGLHSGTHFYGSAYSIPSGAKANHLYVPLDSIPEEEHHVAASPFHIVNEAQQDALIYQLAKLVDSEGYAIASLELGETYK